MPDYHEHVISDPANIQSLSERQSRQCLHLKQVKLKLKVAAHRKRDREPSRVSSRVLKLLKLISFPKPLFHNCFINMTTCLSS